MIDRYEVAGRGHLEGWPGAAWDGLGSGARFPWLWLAMIHLAICVLPVNRPHPSWRWNIYDHQRETWRLNPPAEHSIDAEHWVVTGLVMTVMSVGVLIAFSGDWLGVFLGVLGIVAGVAALRIGYERGGF